jgi:RNA polymerase sigma-70 factor (ECF subfamily)
MALLAFPADHPDASRITALLRGDRSAFVALVDEHHDTMLRVASAMLSSRSVAEEVVQETWLAILDGLARFEGRSSLRTWMFRILANRARTRAAREGRQAPFSSFGNPSSDGDSERSIEADYFDDRGYWREPLERWAGNPERLAETGELLVHIERAMEELPERQRTVLLLRDVRGWTSEEVRNALDLSETNQRVLLHRARARVRALLEPHLRAQR